MDEDIREDGEAGGFRETQMPGRPRMQWVLVLCVWTFFGLFFASQSLLDRAISGQPVEWRKTFIEWLTYSYIWAALTPLVLHLGTRYRIRRPRRTRHALIHLVLGALVAVFHVGVYVFILFPSRWLPAPDPSSLASVFRTLLGYEIHTDVLAYWGIVFLSHAADLQRRIRERELQASRLGARLAQAQLAALKSQLEPHFLFNTLNTISVLMAEDAPSANRVLILLSDLLRNALKDTSAHEVSLGREIEVLSKYLEIEKVRLQDRLHVKIEVDPAAQNARVPNLILQPLAENAVRHGIARRGAGGLLEVLATREGGTLRLLIRDNGPGFQEPVTEGVGLANTRERLKQLYGDSQQLDIRSGPEGGAIVSLTIPYRPAAVEGRSA